MHMSHIKNNQPYAEISSIKNEQFLSIAKNLGGLNSQTVGRRNAKLGVCGIWTKPYLPLKFHVNWSTFIFRVVPFKME